MKRQTRPDTLIEEFFGFQKPAKPVVPILPTRPPSRQDPPADWDPPIHMECGHSQMQIIPRPLDPGEDSYSAKGPSQIVVCVDTVDECHLCRLKIPGDPTFQVGKYRKPVPVSQRRTLAREGLMGWPGYCVDDKGFYIGGHANDCRNNADGQRCVVHRGR